MGRRQLRSDDEAGFLQAITDEWYDLEATENVLIEYRIGRGIKRGELHLLVTAFGNRQNESGRTLCVITHSYPSHRATRLHGALYMALVLLGVHLRDMAREGRR